MELMDRRSRFLKGTGTPFTALGLDYCRHCQMTTDVMQRHYCQGQVYGFKRWCRRCGQTMTGGVHYHATMISAIPNSTFSLAKQWVQAGGKTE